MKKLACLFMIVLSVICLAGCSQPRDSDTQLAKDYSEEYEVSPYGNEELNPSADLKVAFNTETQLDLKQLSFVIENNSDKEYQYSSAYFEIEVEQAGAWYQLKQLNDFTSNEAECIIKPHEQLVYTIDAEHYYGELPAGQYRLIKNFVFFENETDWDYDTFNLSCEFTIG